MSEVKNNNSATEAETPKKGRGFLRVLGIICTGLVLVVVALSALISFTLRWALSFWADLTMDEVVYHLTSPLEGTGDDIMMKFYTSALLPAVAVLLGVSLLLVVIRKWKDEWFAKAVAVIFVLACIVGGLSIRYAWNRLKVDEYLKNQDITSSFIEENYVDPKSVTLTFPKKKRNLIFIFLESVETTFADKKNGGGFDFNCIPELTKLALDNQDFSGSSKKLNGGHVEPGTTFTMGGMFAQTSGLPLQVGLKAQIMDVRGSMNEMYTQEHFFPGITTLGDILDAEGYKNVLFIGSDAVFGGRKLYFQEHGNYEIDDVYYALKRNWLAEKENPWGYCDWRLFPQAMERLNELAEEDEPFNLTMLTLDTHFEDGIRCQNCQAEFPGNTYADVFACSSRQVTDFISWCQEQEWYEDTTIILSGDHTTMDSDFCDDVDEDYSRRTYTCYINADAEVEEASRERKYTTFDNFPTTLAAMGVEIEGDRLGLGTNLFSTEDTLYETYGDEMDTELNRRSLFMEQVSEFDPDIKAYKDIVTKYNVEHGIDMSEDESLTDDSSKSDESKDADESSKSDKSKASDESSKSDKSKTSDDSSISDESKDTDDSSVSDESAALDDSSVSDESAADESQGGEADDTESAAPQVNEDAANWAEGIPFPNDISFVREHLRGKGVAGSLYIKDIMLDPWKEVSAMLTEETSAETVTGASGETVPEDESTAADTSTSESVPADGQIIGNTDSEVEETESVADQTGDTVLSIADIMATRAAQQSDVEESAPEDDSSSEESVPEDDSSSEESIPERSDSSIESKPEGDSSSEESATEDDSSVKESAPKSDSAAEESETDKEALSESTSSAETSESGRLLCAKKSDNPLEIGPTVNQMYPGIYRDSLYGFQPESLLRSDPYAELTGNRQPKEEAAIATRSADELKAWIAKWKAKSEDNK